MLHSSKALSRKRLESEGRFVRKRGKAHALVWFGLVSISFIPFHHTPSHPCQSTYPIPYYLTSFPVYLILSHPIPSYAIPPILHTIPPHFLFFLSHPTLFHATLSHPIISILFHSPNIPLPSHAIPPILLPSTSFPSLVNIHTSHPRWSCSC